MKRIFLYGFYGIDNAGNEAMLRAFTQPIREAFNGDVEFVVANRHPTEEYNETYGVRAIENMEYPSRDKSMGRWLRGLNPDDATHYFQLIKEVANCDLVVLGPGQYLVETGSNGMLKGALGQALAITGACDLTHTPIIGLALACEDLKSPWSKLVAQRILSKMSNVTFRDPKSVTNLQQAGVALPESYQVLGDLALAGQPASNSYALELFEKENIPAKSGNRLVVALRNIYWLGIDKDAYRQRMADIIEAWTSKENRDVVMIPQCVYTIDGDRDDDRVEANLVYDLLSEETKAKVHRIHGHYAPHYTESVYSQCDVTLSARLHGSVFSCKQGTPPVMLTFMDKTRGFFKRLKHEQCLIDLHASASEVSAKLESFLNDREQLSGSILNEVNSIRETAQKYSQIAIDMLGETSSERSDWAREVMNSV